MGQPQLEYGWETRTLQLELRPGDPVHLDSVGAFTAALADVRNTTMTSSRSPEVDDTPAAASVFTFYVDANEYLLLSVAMTTASMQVRCRLIDICRHLLSPKYIIIRSQVFLVHNVAIFQMYSLYFVFGFVNHTVFNKRA